MDGKTRLRTIAWKKGKELTVLIDFNNHSQTTVELREKRAKSLGIELRTVGDFFQVRAFGIIQTFGIIAVTVAQMAADGSVGSKFIRQPLGMEAVANKPSEAADSSATPVEPIQLNCDHGDPAMFDAYWSVHKCEHVMVRSANDALSYFPKSKKQERGGPSWVTTELEEAVRALHALVGNAVTEGSLVVVGNGSTQLFQAALYALASDRSPPPGNPSTRSVAVVAQSPFYSAYPQIINYMQSKLFHWAGDSRAYQPTRNETCIEMITSPNNPSGELREGLVRNEEGFRLCQVYDLAYYWPTYMPITAPLDHDIMLFTLSKCTGHAGLRIGWAIVKDPVVAKKMAEFVVMNTIGVSQDSQSRAAGILRAIVRDYETDVVAVAEPVRSEGEIEGMLVQKKLFHWGKAVMESRWERVRAALAGNKQFSLPEPPVPTTCTLLGTAFSPSAAFIWLKCEEEEADCQMILKRKGILTRSGVSFGVSPQYARLSLLDREPAVDLLVKRLAALSC